MRGGNTQSIPISPGQRLRTIILWAVGGLMIALSLAYFALSTDKPYMGLDLAKEGDLWEVQAVDSTGLAAAAGIRAGDIAKEVNGQPPEIALASYAQAGTAWGPLIKELQTAGPQGQVRTVSLQGGAQSVESTLELVLRLLASLIFWAIGCYVFLKRRHSGPAVLFYLCCLLIGLILLANMGSTRALPGAAMVEVYATLVGPWLLLQFFLVLPEERSGLSRKPVLYLVYLPAAITLILFPLIGWADGQPVTWFRSLRLLECGLGFLAAAGVAVYNFFFSRSLKTRQQMKIVLIGSLCALVPVAVINVLPQALWDNQTVLPAGFSILLLLFIPAGMGYAILNQQLLDIDLVIRRGVVYGAITLLTATILSVAILLVIALGARLSIGLEVILAIVLGALATALFGPTKAGAEFLADKYLYKDRYDYRQIINRLSLALNSSHDLNEICRLVVGTAVNTLNLSGGCLLVKNQAGALEIGATQGIFSDPANQQALLKLAPKRQNPAVSLDLDYRTDEDQPLIIPLLSGEREVGLLCVARKSSRQRFSHNDLFLLQGLSSVASIALRSALLARDVSVRDTFVSIASHELRSPLTSIIGYADLILQRDPPEAKRRLWLQHILESGRSVSGLVDDLLNITRIQSGKLVMKREKVSLPEILRERFGLAREMNGTHNLILDVPADLPDVYLDRQKFGQVLDNLINNAIKYSPQGGEIRLSARLDAALCRVVLAVKDQGIGIGPEDRKSLFTTFHRIKRPETEGIKGSGLGLYIAKEWIEAMGGEIWLESELNKGSTFFISLPLEASNRNN
jgi:signal transduction histidine kinase